MANQEMLSCGGPPQASWSSGRQEQNQAAYIGIGIEGSGKLAEICIREGIERLLARRHRGRTPQVHGPQDQNQRWQRDKECFLLHFLSSEAIGDKSSNLLGKKNHSQDHDEGGPQQ